MKNIKLSIIAISVTIGLKAQITELPNGNVGIGTNTPNERLSITGPSAALGIYDTNPNSKANNRIARYGNSLVFQNDLSGTWKDNINFADNGNVGIGVKNPTNKFQIGENPAGYSSNDMVVSNSRGSFVLHNADKHTYLWANRDMAIRPNGKIAIYANASNGYVGIGVKNPTNKFQIGENPAEYSSNDMVVSNSRGSFVLHNADEHTYLWANRDIAIRPNGKIAIYANASNGYVGIGIKKPTNKFQIGENPAGYSNNDMIVSNSKGTFALHNADEHTYLWANRDMAIRPNGKIAIYATANNGYVGIGTTSPDMKLTVKGNIHAEEVKIDLNIPAPDYVFKDGYNLRSIEEVEKFIKEYSHLPEIPSAKEFEQNGVMQAEMDMNLLKKIEELTLYTIEQEKKINNLEKDNKSLKTISSKLIELQKRLEKLEDN